jgi:hypothetical protein
MRDSTLPGIAIPGGIAVVILNFCSGKAVFSSWVLGLQLYVSAAIVSTRETEINRCPIFFIFIYLFMF